MPGIVPPSVLLKQTAVVDTNKVKFTFGDLENLWIQAGGDPAKAKIAAAVAMAESGGVRTAQHTNSDGTIDRGPWQINSVHGAQSTIDARANADAAVAISKNGTDWTPWTTFKSGAFRKFLSGKDVPAATIASGGSVPGVTDLNVPGAGAIGAVGDFLGKLGVIFHANFWLRVALGLGGLVLIGFAVVTIGKQYMPKNLPPIIPV